MAAPIDWTRFPKVDLHRHLEGSLRLDTLEEAAASPHYRGAADGLARLKAHVAGGGCPRSPEEFLSVFPLIRRFFVTPEFIERMAYEAAEDAQRDGVRHLELRFNPVALAEARGMELAAACECVAAGARRARESLGLSLSLIITINRAERKGAERLLRLAVDFRSRGVAGLDLAGDEVHIDAGAFRGIFAEAAGEGLGLTAHAGEWAGPERVRQAIEELGAMRIGHGIRVMDDPAVSELAFERGVLFEVCLSSNVLTGAVPDLRDHPFAAMHRRGLRTCLGTDDPGLSGLRLSGEHGLAGERFGLRPAELAALGLEALRGAFIGEEERRRLMEGWAGPAGDLECWVR